jgi:hypothetical protein
MVLQLFNRKLLFNEYETDNVTPINPNETTPRNVQLNARESSFPIKIMLPNVGKFKSDLSSSYSLYQKILKYQNQQNTNDLNQFISPLSSSDNTTQTLSLLLTSPNSPTMLTPQSSSCSSLNSISNKSLNDEEDEDDSSGRLPFALSGLSWFDSLICMKSLTNCQFNFINDIYRLVYNYQRNCDEFINLSKSNCFWRFLLNDFELNLLLNGLQSSETIDNIKKNIFIQNLKCFLICFQSIVNELNTFLFKNEFNKNVYSFNSKFVFKLTILVYDLLNKMFKKQQKQQQLDDNYFSNSSKSKSNQLITVFDLDQSFNLSPIVQSMESSLKDQDDDDNDDETGGHNLKLFKNEIDSFLLNFFSKSLQQQLIQMKSIIIKDNSFGSSLTILNYFATIFKKSKLLFSFRINNSFLINNVFFFFFEIKSSLRLGNRWKFLQRYQLL